MSTNDYCTNVACFFLWNELRRIQFTITYFRVALERHVELDYAPPWPVMPVEHEYLMLGTWCNWYFEGTSLLSPVAFSFLSGSDYREDTETGCVCTHSQTHGNNYSVWGIGSSVSVCPSLSSYCLSSTVSMMKHLTFKTSRLLLCYLVCFCPFPNSLFDSVVSQQPNQCGMTHLFFDFL